MARSNTKLIAMLFALIVLYLAGFGLAKLESTSTVIDPNDPLFGCIYVDAQLVCPLSAGPPSDSGHDPTQWPPVWPGYTLPTSEVKTSDDSTLSNVFTQTSQSTSDEATSTAALQSQDTEPSSLENVTLSTRDDDLPMITCLTDKAITLPKLAIMQNFVEPFCQSSAGKQLRGTRIQSGSGAYVWADPIKLGFRIGTKIWVQPENWTYVVKQDLCVQIFQVIANKCAEESVFKGGLWFTNHVVYEFRLLEI